MTDPLCEVCLRRDKLVSAEHVDHRIAIKAGGHPFPPFDGLMSMCPSCHSIKTNAMDKPGGSGIAFKGCDEYGRPIDPDHPFYCNREGGQSSREGAGQGPAWETNQELVEPESKG
jgi:hypothetical protein